MVKEEVYLEDPPAFANEVSTPGVIAVIVGSVAFALAVMMSVCIFAVRRSQRKRDRTNIKQFLLPKDVKPVMSFKTAAGPGGLKKSPSPIQSPDNPDKDWSRRGTYSSESGSSSTSKSTTMEDVVKIDCEMDDTSNMKCDNSNNNGIDYCKPGAIGTMNFNLHYNFEKNALKVTIVGANNLPPKKQPLEQIKRSPSDEGFSLLDPYVKLQLLPEKQHKVKTRVTRNTLNPVYDEEFTFYGINYNQLQSTKLHFVVVGFDRYSRDEIIGEILFPLHSVDLSDAVEIPLTKELTNKTAKFQNQQNRGELLVSLCYQPAASRITAVVLKAKELPKFDITGLADPYVKAYLLYNGQRVAKKKTHVKKKTLEPVFNESFTFDLPCSEPEAIDNVSLEFLVMDWDRVTKNEVMGRAEIGLSAKTTVGSAHWQAVKDSPRKQIAEWHKLRA